MKSIMELARQANLPACHTTHPKALARFAALIRAEVLDELADMVDACDRKATPKGIAAAIRALAKEKT
jgi:hypothetical protein